MNWWAPTMFLANCCFQTTWDSVTLCVASSVLQAEWNSKEYFNNPSYLTPYCVRKSKFFKILRKINSVYTLVYISLLCSRPIHPTGHFVGTSKHTYSKKYLNSLWRARSSYPILKIILHYFFPLLFGYLIVKVLPPKYFFNWFLPFPSIVTAISQVVTRVTTVNIMHTFHYSYQEKCSFSHI